MMVFIRLLLCGALVAPCLMSRVKTLGPTFNGCTWQWWLSSHLLVEGVVWIVGHLENENPRRLRCLYIVSFLRHHFWRIFTRSRGVATTGGVVAVASLCLLWRRVSLFYFSGYVHPSCVEARCR